MQGDECQVIQSICFDLSQVAMARLWSSFVLDLLRDHFQPTRTSEQRHVLQRSSLLSFSFSSLSLPEKSLEARRVLGVVAPEPPPPADGVPDLCE